MTGSDIALQTSDGIAFRAYSATSPGAGRTGVVILPDIRGLDSPYVEIARRFSSHGYHALAIDIFGRTSGARDWKKPAAWEQLIADSMPADIAASSAAAVAHLRSTHGGACEKVFALGFGYGGAHAFLQGAADHLGLDGVLGFYARLEPPSPDGAPSPLERARHVACPLLGLFGGKDTAALPPSIASFDASLKSAGVPHSLIVYSLAGHAFFDRAGDTYPDIRKDAWRRTLDFIQSASAGDTRGLTPYTEVGRPSAPAWPVPVARPSGPVITKGPYFPPPEEQGGWRSVSTREEVAARGLDPDRLEAMWKWSAAVQHAPPRPPSQMGLAVIADGWLVYERYDRPGTQYWPRWIASIGKSVASCVFGQWVEAGRKGGALVHIELESPLYDPRYLPEGFPLSDERKQKIIFRHVFTHTSGIQPEPDTRGGAGYRWVDYTVGRHPAYRESAALKFDPGTGYGYSSVSFNHLSVISPHLTGRMLHEHMRKGIFEPIGALSASWQRPDGEAAAYEDPEGRYMPGAGGPHLTTRDLARYAYLHLNDGGWAGSQVVPAWYLREARDVVRFNARQPSDYGLGFWTNAKGALSKDLPTETFGFGGAGLNLVAVVPQVRLIVVRTSRVWTANFDQAKSQFFSQVSGLLRR